MFFAFFPSQDQNFEFSCRISSLQTSDDAIEKNEQSGIEAELPVDKKEKVFLKEEGTIEIDRKRYLQTLITKSEFRLSPVCEGI